MKFFIQIACVGLLAAAFVDCAPNSTIVRPPGARDFEGSSGSPNPVRSAQKNSTVPFTIFRRSASNDTKPHLHREVRQTVSVVPVGSGINVTSPSTSSNRRNSTTPARPKPIRTNSTSSHPSPVGASSIHVNPPSSLASSGARPVRSSEDDAPKPSHFSGHPAEAQEKKEEKHSSSSEEGNSKESEDGNSRPHRPVFGNFGNKQADAESP